MRDRLSLYVSLSLSLSISVTLYLFEVMYLFLSGCLSLSVCMSIARPFTIGADLRSTNRVDSYPSIPRTPSLSQFLPPIPSVPLFLRLHRRFLLFIRSLPWFPLSLLPSSARHSACGRRDSHRSFYDGIVVPWSLPLRRLLSSRKSREKSIIIRRV